MSNALIEERDARTARRKKAKEHFDSLIQLSGKAKAKEVKRLAFESQPVLDRPKTLRLLDEGSVIRGDDEIDFYIKKGTLKAYVEVLPDDFVGTINLGHLSFAEFPFILGEWTKENLHLVDIGDGRQALEIDNTIDYESVFVKELLRMPYSIGISGEFAYSVDEEASEEYNMEVLDGIFLYAYALVGDAGNVNSSGIELSAKGGTEVTFTEIEKKLEQQTEDYSGINEELDKLLESEEAVEETAEVAEPSEDEVEAEEVTEQEEAEQEAEEDEADVAEESETEKVLSVLVEKLEQMNARIEALEGEKEVLEQKLSAKESKEAEIVEKFKRLIPTIADNAPVDTVKYDVLKTDGMGVI